MSVYFWITRITRMLVRRNWQGQAIPQSVCLYRQLHGVCGGGIAIECDGGYVSTYQAWTQRNLQLNGWPARAPAGEGRRISLSGRLSPLGAI